MAIFQFAILTNYHKYKNPLDPNIHNFPMVFPLNHNFPKVFLWFFRKITIFLWFSCRLPSGLPMSFQAAQHPARCRRGAAKLGSLVVSPRTAPWPSDSTGDLPFTGFSPRQVPYRILGVSQNHQLWVPSGDWLHSYWKWPFFPSVSWDLK